MTYSKDKIVGLSMADAIGVICTAITDASRWASFRGDIMLSENKAICIDSGSAYENHDLLILGGLGSVDTYRNQMTVAAMVTIAR